MTDDRFPALSNALDPAQVRALIELVDRLVEARLSRVWTCHRGTIEVYDTATGQARVKLAGRQQFEGETGKESSDPLVLPGVPVVAPKSLVWDVAAGDEVAIWWCRRSVEEFHDRGDTDFEPRTRRRFDVSDSFCMVLTHDQAKVTTTKGIARLDDNVDRNAAMATWMAAVEVAASVPALVGTQIGDISTASTAVDVE